MSRRALIVAFFVLLFVLHQDFWWRDDPTLVLGILPVSLAYHVFWTVLVAIGWYLVARFCWPHELDEETSNTAAVSTSIGTSDPASRVAAGTTSLPGKSDGAAGGTPALPGKSQQTRR